MVVVDTTTDAGAEEEEDAATRRFPQAGENTDSVGLWQSAVGLVQPATLTDSTVLYE